MSTGGATVGSHLSARVAVYVPSADGLIVAAAVQLVERVPSDACHELFVHVARGRHVETHGAVRLWRASDLMLTFEKPLPIPFLNRLRSVTDCSRVQF